MDCVDKRIRYETKGLKNSLRRIFTVTEALIYSLFPPGIICQTRWSNKNCALESSGEGAWV